MRSNCDFLKRFVVFLSLGCAWVIPGFASQASNISTKPLIIPQPKSVQLGAGKFQVTADDKWVLQAPTQDERLWAAVTKLPGSGTFEKSAEAYFLLRVGPRDPISFPNGSTLPTWATNAEGYKLSVNKNGIVILASTAQGAFYGIQTLEQLSKGQACPAVEIEDWPSMRFRGVHWFPSKSGVQMHRKLIENVFGPLKFNQSIIQCEAARWDSHPEIAGPNSISKADLRQLVDFCRSHFIEPTPLINTPGHAEWAFRNGNHLDFAEDPKTPYAYCVNNPKSFEFMQDILKECLPLFQSRFCHLGHDEVTMRGRFPNPDCRHCKNATVTGLVVQHANQMSEWLAQQGIQTMIWGDMLLGPGEANDATHAKTLVDSQERRARISKKITITDWHYAGKTDARSLEILQKAGFPVIAATFHAPNNIHHFSQAALASGAEGLLQTTWMGYFPDEHALKTQIQQFTAFVLAAEYAWSGRQEPPTALGYDPQTVFLEAYGKKAKP